MQSECHPWKVLTATHPTPLTLHTFLTPHTSHLTSLTHLAPFAHAYARTRTHMHMRMHIHMCRRLNKSSLKESFMCAWQAHSMHNACAWYTHGTMPRVASLGGARSLYIRAIRHCGGEDISGWG